MGWGLASTCFTLLWLRQAHKTLYSQWTVHNDVELSNVIQT